MCPATFEHPTSTYDGLNRLIGAVESPGSSYRYAYDLVGNRTDVWVDGTRVEHRAYDAANQVVGWSYDAAGNLLNDGTTSYTYDALNRLTRLTQGSTTTTYQYTGDGVLVAQTQGGTTTHYAQDLVAPLSQVLQTSQDSSTTSYVDGHARLVARSGITQTWYGHDALGSVRQTLDGSGAPLSALHYDPWGVPRDGATPPTFGFTGELQEAGGLVYLRARWYQPQQGRFLSRDPYPGDATTPQSLHSYAYTHNNSVNFTDPTGMYLCISGPGYRTTGRYNKFCWKQRKMLDQVLNVSNLQQSTIQKQPLDILIRLFSSTPYQDLPGGSGAEAQQHRVRWYSPAAERLEFVLWYTQTPGGRPFSHDRVSFSDVDFAPEFQDHQLEGRTSNQVNHFLTAVDLTYSRIGYVTDWVTVGCLIGHERYGQGTASEPEQCFNPTNTDRYMFHQAVISDEVGDYSSRDCLVQKLLPGLPEYYTPGSLPNRRGNSIQDLRLSIKGYIFGSKIRTGQITTLEEARNWLATNLRRNR